MARQSTIKQHHKKKQKAVSKRCSNSFKDMDMYGEKISLTFKGKETFNTVLGAIVTIVVLVVMILYSMRMLRVMIERTGTVISSS